MICANSYAEHQYNAYEADDERFEEVGEYAEEFVARFGEDYMYQMPYSAVKVKINDLDDFLLNLEEHEKTAEYIHSQAFYNEWFKDYFVDEFVEKFGSYIDSDEAVISEIYEAFSDALSEKWENIKKQVIAKIGEKNAG